LKLLITGGAGFIGIHLARFHATRGDDVVLFDNLFKSAGERDRELEELTQLSNVELVEVDLTRPIQADVTGSFDLVYHLAAINGTRLFYEIPYTVARTNLLCTLHLLDWLEGQTVEKLVYASTSETYAEAGKVGLLRIPSDEDTPVVFTQPTPVRYSYGTSKFMGENLCVWFGSTRGVPVSVVRYHNIYGPRMGDKHVMPEFITRLQQGEDPFSVYGGDETRAFCYVDDAVEATAAVGESEACEGETIHIGDSSREIRIDELARIMMELMGVQGVIEERGGRSGSVSRRCPDTSKLKRLTGYVARTDLEEGLKQTISWYLRPA